MTHRLKALVLSAAFAMTAICANAATVVSTGTFDGNTLFVSSSAGPLVGVSDPYYLPDDADSGWVWDLNDLILPVTYTLSFDLTGYDLSTVSISGLWGADNYGTIMLNGGAISVIPFGLDAFQSLTAYSGAGGLLLGGLNTLEFVISNGNPGDPNEDPGPTAFRATALVTADLAAVPLPAGLPMLLGALGLMGFAARRRRDQA